jgi:hypothetical protein
LAQSIGEWQFVFVHRPIPSLRPEALKEKVRRIVGTFCRKVQSKLAKPEAIFFNYKTAAFDAIEVTSFGPSSAVVDHSQHYYRHAENDAGHPSPPLLT